MSTDSFQFLRVGLCENIAVAGAGKHFFFISFPVFVSVFHCGQGMNGYEELPSQVSHDQNVWYKLPRSLLIKKDQLQLIYNIYSGNFFF